MTLNLKAPEGVAALKRMVKKADVVVENFRPDVKKRLRIEYKDLKKVNPKIISVVFRGSARTDPMPDGRGSTRSRRAWAA